MDTSANAIKIDVAGRYLFFIQFNRPVSMAEYDAVQKKTTEALNRWWNSDDKFGVFVVGEGVELRVERVEDAPSTLYCQNKDE